MTRALSGFVGSCSNALTFAVQWARHPREVGTPFACSDAVAREILRFVPSKSNEKMCVLEIGPGNGVFTDRLVEMVGPNTEVHLVEIVKKFADGLIEKYKNNPNVHVHNMAIQDFKPAHNAKFYFIAGAVPHNALPNPQLLQSLFDSYVRLAGRGSVFSCVEYIGTSTLSGWFKFGEKSRIYDEVQKLKATFFRENAFETNKVWKNLPPARVMHLRLNEGSSK